MDIDNDEIWRGEVTNELRHIAQNISEVKQRIDEVGEYVVQQVEEHRVYHEQNEQRWGAMKWCEKHPLRLVAFLVAVFTCSAAGNSVEDWSAMVNALAGLFP